MGSQAFGALLGIDISICNTYNRDIPLIPALPMNCQSFPLILWVYGRGNL
jgi:hypothetical protein